jgi:putative transposase
MKHNRFSEEQIIAMLKENEAGAKVDALCRRHGVSGATFYAWRQKFGGMEPSDAKRLRELEAENAKLKRIVADQVLDMSAMKELLRKHW